MGLSRMRDLGLQSSEGWCGPRARRHPRRYVMAETDPAYLDPQQTGLGHAGRGRSDVRGAAARVVRRKAPTPARKTGGAVLVAPLCAPAQGARTYDPR